MRLRSSRPRFMLLYTSAFGVVLLLLLVSLFMGTSDIPMGSVLNILFGQAENDSQHAIIYQLRLPRALLAIGIGAVLAMSGTMTQGLFRNPLADPSLIGVSAGAAAGASLIMAFAVPIPVSIGAFLGGVMTVAIVYRIARNATGLSVVTMLLAGLAMNFLAGSFTSVLELLGSDDFLRRMSLWRMGGVDNASYTDVFIIAATVAIFALACPFMARALNALLLGESEARHLGFAIHRIKVSVILLVAMGIGLSVSIAGMIAFIGLIVPHGIRILIGPNHTHLLPLSAIVGAGFLLLADTVARTFFAPIEMPVGLMTAFLGAPLFIFLLRQRTLGGLR